MSEEWRWVVGHEGQYEVSDLGNVRSVDRVGQQNGRGGKSHVHSFRGRMLRPGIGGNGYPTVALGRGNTRTVHSLVAEAFIGPVPLGMEVLHRDGTRTNAQADNLRYGTRTENILDAVANGTWMTEKRLAHMRRIGFGNRPTL
jgi:hypothetical protein